MVLDAAGLSSQSRPRVRTAEDRNREAWPCRQYCELSQCSFESSCASPDRSHVSNAPFRIRAQKPKGGVPLSLLGRIENGQAEGDEWGLREICALSDAMGAAAHELMDRWEHCLEQAGEAWWQAGKEKD
jgi:hypothetical protein